LILKDFCSMKEFQPRHDQTRFNPEKGKGTRGVRQPEPEGVQTPVESTEGNSSAQLTPEQQGSQEKVPSRQLRYYYRRREERAQSMRDWYQKHREEKLAYQQGYRENHRQQIAESNKRYYKRRKEQASVEAEPQQPIQVFPSP
jgi:hypothetical protein